MSKPLLLAMLSLTLVGAAPAPNPDEIVAKADEVRNPQLDYTVLVTVTSVKPSRRDRRARYEVLIKGKEKTLIKTLEPANERGTSILMLGKDLWAYLPDVSQPVRMSLQQRLIGEVSIGDIARANLAGDYGSRLLSQEKGHYLLELLAKTDDVTYHKVAYSVQTTDFHPARANFYAESGKLLKKCDFVDYKQLGGRLRPSRLIMIDPIVRGQKSIVEYEKFTVGELPDKYFTKDYLKKFKY